MDKERIPETAPNRNAQSFGPFMRKERAFRVSTTRAIKDTTRKPVTLFISTATTHGSIFDMAKAKVPSSCECGRSIRPNKLESSVLAFVSKSIYSDLYNERRHARLFCKDHLLSGDAVDAKKHADKGSLSREKRNTCGTLENESLV